MKKLFETISSLITELITFAITLVLIGIFWLVVAFPFFILMNGSID